MKKTWKKLLAVGCALSMVMTAPGMSVLAEELQEEEIVVTDVEEVVAAEIPDDELTDSGEVAEDVSVAYVLEEADELTDDVEMVGSIKYTVGDGVTATFDEETGAVEFNSDGGTLWNDWREQSGLDSEEIKSIKVASGIVYLPEDSSRIFSIQNYVSYYDEEDDEEYSWYVYPLEELDLSSFDTSKVTNMSGMFEYCENLSSLDLSDFDTSEVTSMCGMFYKCRNLDNLNLRGFDTSNVTNMSSMFCGCDRLSSLDLSGFNTTNVEDMEFMFAGCSFTNIDLSGFETKNVTSMKGMFKSCDSLVSLNLSSFNTSNVTDMGYMFAYCGNLTELNISSFATPIVTSMDHMFVYCGNLTELNLNCFDTSNVTDMGGMFASCSRLTELDLSGFDTSKVEDMGGMFCDCSSLTNLNLSGFDLSNVEYIWSFFEGCYALSVLETPKKNSIEIELPSLMYDESDNGYDNLPLLEESITLTKKLKKIVVGDDVTATYDKITGTLELYSDGGTLWKDWLEKSGLVNSRITSIRAASGIVYLPEDSERVFSVKYYNYEEDYEYGWYDYPLEELDLSNFDTSKVKNMSNMFEHCDNLKSLDLSAFDTSKVTNMYGMFSYCTDLENLDLRGFDTSDVTNMGYMFNECYSLSSLDLSGFNTMNVSNMEHMFSDCLWLESQDLSGFNTTNVENMDFMFSGCDFTELDLSMFETKNAKSMGGMFYRCDRLTKLDLSCFDTTNVKKMAWMFSGCKDLMELDIISFDTSNVVSMSEMFNGCGSLTELDIRNFNTTNVKDMEGMFYGCESLESLDLSNFNTSKVEKMSYSDEGYGMFCGCSKLKSLDLSSFDTSNVKDMGAMFDGCSSLINLDLSGFDMTNVHDYQDIFSGCLGLQLLKSPRVNSLLIDLPVIMYDESGNEYTKLPTLSKSITLTKDKPTVAIDISDCTLSLSATSYTYDGKAKQPTVTVKNGDVVLTSGTDYTVSYADNTNAGTATVKVTGTGNYIGEKSVTFTIKKANAKLTFAESTVTKRTTDAAFTNALTKTTDGTVTFKSGDTKVATVDSASGLVTIKGAGTATITATASEGKNYKAGSASYSLTIEAPAPTSTPTPAVTGFSDVQNPKHAYYNAIYWAAEEGITKGYPDGTFGINKSCTRGEMIMFLWRYAGKPAPKAVSKSPFKDVAKSHAFYKAILWASQKGITKGYPDGTFGIDRNVSRGECMMFLWRVKGKPAPKAVAKSPFKDVATTNAFYKAILWGYQNKITTGYTSGAKKGTFGINENCTRGQIVTFLFRAK